MLLFLSLLVGGILNGAQIALVATGFGLIFFTARELHFAYGETIVLGGYLLYAFTGKMGLPVPIAVVLAIVCCAAFGALVRLVLYRRVRSHEAVLLLSFGLAIIIQNLLEAIYGPSVKSVDPGRLGKPIHVLPGTDVLERWIDLIGLGVLVIVWPAMFIFLRRSQIGLGMNAVMRDPDMAELSGVRPERMKVLAYAAGSALAGIVGVLTTSSTGISPSGGLQFILLAFIAALLARDRINQIPAWAIGIGVLLSMSAWKLPSQYQTLITFGVLMGYLVIRTRRSSRMALT
jgi:branched-chain amino acid transport system permease protein